MTVNPVMTSKTSLSPGQTEGTLKRKLGVFSIILMVVAGAAPLAVVSFSLPMILVVTETINLPIFYALSGLIIGVFAVGYLAMTKHVPNATAFYTYVQVGLGRIPGTGAALLGLAAYVLLTVSIFTYSGMMMQELMAGYFGIDITWWVWSILAMLIIGFIGYRAADLGVKVLVVLVGAELVILMVANAAILLQGGAEGLDAEPFNPALMDGSTLGLGILFAAMGYYGFEATAVFRNEAKNPDKTIPRAAYLSVLLIGIFYIVSSWVIIMGTGSSNAVAMAGEEPETLVLSLGAVFVGAAFPDLMLILVITSTLACALAFHNIIARYVFTLARAGAMPKWAGKVHPQMGAPSRASVVVTIAVVIVLLIAVLADLDPYMELMIWFDGAGGLALIASMALTSLAIIAFFRRTKKDTRAWQTRIAPGLAALGLAAVLFFVVLYFPLLVESVVAARVIGLGMVGVFLAGVAYAVFLKYKRPERYAQLDILSDEDIPETIVETHTIQVKEK